MKEMVIPIVIGALGTTPKRMLKERDNLKIKEKNSDHPD